MRLQKVPWVIRACVCLFLGLNVAGQKASNDGADADKTKSIKNCKLMAYVDPNVFKRIFVAQNQRAANFPDLNLQRIEDLESLQVHDAEVLPSKPTRLRDREGVIRWWHMVTLDYSTENAIGARVEKTALVFMCLANCDGTVITLDYDALPERLRR